MILFDKRDAVIANIKQAAESGNFNCKVEVNDPELTMEERERLIQHFFSRRRLPGPMFLAWVARRMTDLLIMHFNDDTKVVGYENLRGVKGGAIVTSNHFSPFEILAMRKCMNNIRKRLYFVSQESNLKMTGLFGFLMNYMDIIPCTPAGAYMQGRFFDELKRHLSKEQYVLLYTEQEMWFNYRKPRPPKRGAYYYAAKAFVPIISCFVEIIDKPSVEKNNPDFFETKYTVHILKPIFPDPEKDVRQNSLEMMKRDYEQKCAAYEAAYGKPLSYAFESSDIGGWRGSI